MPIAIKHKSSSTASAVPSANDLVLRELALNTADGKIFAKTAAGAVVTFSNDSNSPNRVLFDSDDPGSGEGSNGNLWLNTTSKELFYKSGGAWALIATLSSGSGEHTHPLSQLQQSSAQTDQFVKWNGTDWVPAFPPVADYFPPDNAVITGDVSVVATEDLVLVCAAEGPSLSYQWKRNGVDVGTDSPTLTVVGATTGDAGTYLCLVSNSNGSVLSNELVVVVQVAPAIATETPPDETPTLNAMIAFAITATGTSVQYEWQYSAVGVTYTPISNGGTTSGAATNTLNIQAVAEAEGYYRCRAFNAVGEALSSAMPIAMSPPVIVTQPEGIGSGGTAAVVASGVGTLAYQWLYGGVIIGAQTTDILTVDPAAVDLLRGLKFSCRVSNAYGSVTSAEVSCRPFIHGSDSGYLVPQRGTGIPLYMVAAIVGPPGTTYSWKKNGVACGGGTDVFGDSVPILIIKDPQPGDSGTYVCRGENAYGYVDSGEFNADVSDNVAVHRLPIEVRVFDDETLNLELTALMAAIYQTYSPTTYNVPCKYRYDGAVLPNVGGVPDYDLKQNAFVRKAEFTPNSETYAISNSAEEWKTIGVSLAGATMPVEANWRFVIRKQDTEVVPNSDPAVSYNTVANPWITVDENSYIATGVHIYDTTLASFMAYVITKAAVSGITSGPLVRVLGGSVSITVTASGDNLQYAWYRDGVRCPLQSTDNFTKEAVEGDEGSYVCKVGNESYQTKHVATSGACVVEIIGIKSTPASGNFSTIDTVTADFCGIPENVEFALVADGSVGTYQDSPILVIGDNFGVPLKIRIRHKTQTDKFHDSGEFTATQIFKWKVTFCGYLLSDGVTPASTNGHVSLNQIFPNTGFVDINNANGDTDYYLPTATALGQTHNHQVSSSYGTQCVTPHNITCTSV